MPNNRFRISYIIVIILVGAFAFYLGFTPSRSNVPNDYYQVYIDGDMIGMVEDQEQLEEFINQKEEAIKKNTEQVTRDVTFDLIFDLVNSGSLASEEGMKRVGLTDDDFKKELEKYRKRACCKASMSVKRDRGRVPCLSHSPSMISTLIGEHVLYHEFFYLF